MNLKQRFIAWRIARLIKKEYGMKPLPKWVGVLSILLAAFGSGGALAGLVPIKIAALLSTGATVLANLTHSLPGTGGTMGNP